MNPPPNPRTDLHHDRRWEGRRPTNINVLHAQGVNPNGGDIHGSGNMTPGIPPPMMSKGGGMADNGTTGSM